MNDLLETRFFNLLSENSQKITTDEMKNAYENLVRKIEELNQPDGDYAIIYRSLNMTRIEFVSLSQHYRYEQGEKCA